MRHPDAAKSKPRGIGVYAKRLGFCGVLLLDFLGQPNYFIDGNVEKVCNVFDRDTFFDVLCNLSDKRFLLTFESAFIPNIFKHSAHIITTPFGFLKAPHVICEDVAVHVVGVDTVEVVHQPPDFVALVAVRAVHIYYMRTVAEPVALITPPS